MAIAVYGKHPAKGDFLAAGMPPGLMPLVESWLDTALAEVRETLGQEWPTTWATAPQLRFWLGEAIWGSPVAGVIAPTQDRVGRRFPLVLLLTGADAPPPPILPNEEVPDWHDQAAAHLTAALARSDFARPADLLDGAPLPAAPEGVVTAEPPEFWAVQPGPDPQSLWADVTTTDHRRAASTRSYWWVAGETAADPGKLDAPEPTAQDPDPADPDPAPEPPPEPELDAPEDDEDTGSPFDAPGASLALFARPEPGTIAPVKTPIAPAPTQTLAPRAPLWSQVWAGDGLPSGNVLAWLLRGHVAND